MSNEAIGELVARLEEPIWECDAYGKIVPIVDMWRADMRAAATALASQEAEIAELRKALAECAAEWRSPPTTIGGAMEHVSAEFKRRMQVAADALAKTVEG